LLSKDIKNLINNWNVLFVDDEKFVVDTMRSILPMLFKNSHFAYNGIDGVNICKENKIDLLITDLSMPKMNGIDMIKQIKSFHKDIKVICISGHNEQEYLKEAKELNASFIIKPISSAALYNAINEII